MQFIDSFIDSLIHPARPWEPEEFGIVWERVTHTQECVEGEIWHTFEFPVFLLGQDVTAWVEHEGEFFEEDAVLEKLADQIYAWLYHHERDYLQDEL